jgi:hypothetical protein
MARFLRQYYQGRVVVANDIGLINYLADFHCVDWWGLGSIDAARSRLAGHYTGDKIEWLANEHQAEIAVVYEDWMRFYAREVPSHWRPIEHWAISNNMICAGSMVTFDAVKPEAEAQLRKNLAQFHAQLPPEVKVAPGGVARGMDPGSSSFFRLTR